MSGTWYAYVLYVLTGLGAVFIAWRTASNRIRLRNRLQIAEIERQKNDELAQSKLRFFTNISHEFLTPLTIIGCSAEALENGGDGSDNGLKVIKNNVVRLRNLIRQVLDFNKVETGKATLQVKDSDITEVVRNICANDFEMLARERDITLTCETPRTINGWYDPDKVDKIVTNLLSNAFKYNYDNSFVHVSVVEDYDETHRYAVISVKDGGVGIAPDKIGRIFENFYDNDFREIRKEGTGIGLALTKSLVELHKGTISVESIPGEGTSFTVRIPVNEGSYTQEERKASIPMLSGDMPLNTVEAGRRILIVEDNSELRLIMGQYLVKYYVVESAADGMEAVGKLKDSVFDIVITDLMMPRMDGEQLCRYIKTNIEYSHIPVIVLTAKTGTEDRIKLYDIGADAYITKPFQMPLLVSRISNLLRGREELMNNFAKSDDSVQLQSITYTSLDEKFIANAVRIVEENISNEDFSFDAFTGEMNVSKSTLYRKIKSLTGMTTTDFIKDIRLKNACRIMKEKTVSVAEVAYQVGFGQPKYFTYCFKKKYGILPTEYMAREKDGK